MRPGWCTNVLPTRCAEELGAAVEAMATCIPESAPVGLWLPDHVLGDDPAAAVAPIAATLRRIGAPLLGLNTFPQGDFHQNRVKDAVYQPAWGDQCRLDYTLRAAEAVIALTQPGDEIGLTTVPIGWPSHAIDLDAARSMLCAACEELDLLSERSDRTIFLAVEPEPRCVLPTAASLAAFVKGTTLQDAAARGTLRACLDACHLAVEHESPDEAVATLHDAQIRIGRVQISSAPEASTPLAIAAMQSLDEERWMHQTSVLVGDALTIYNDLSETHGIDPEGVWRTHLHIPVHRATFGALHSTQSWIPLLIRAVAATGQRPPVEVETYAWDVLPPSFRQATVQDEIARELEWTMRIMQEVGW